MDITDPTPVADAEEEDQAARLAKFKEHQHKVKVYRVNEDDEDDPIKQKSIKAPKPTTASKQPKGPQPIIRKRLMKKSQSPKKEEEAPPPQQSSIDTEKLLLGCVCIGLGLYLIYLTRQGTLVAKEIVSDT